MINVNQIAAVFGTIWDSHGPEYKVTCPKCSTKALWINVRKHAYHCFSCGDGGALQLLVPGWAPSITAQWVGASEKETFEIPDVLPLSYMRIRSRCDYRPGWDYIEHRGVQAGAVEWGVVPGDSAVYFPMREQGRIVYWQSRSHSWVEKRKTQNPKGIAKSEVVYRIDELGGGDVFHAICIIVEGIFDALRVGGVATLGKTCSPAQAYKILNRRPYVIFVVYDDDAYEASKVTAKMFSEMDRSIPAIPVYITGGDPADLGWDYVRLAIRAALWGHESICSLCGVSAKSIETRLLEMSPKTALSCSRLSPPR